MKIVLTMSKTINTTVHSGDMDDQNNIGNVCNVWEKIVKICYQMFEMFEKRVWNVWVKCLWCLRCIKLKLFDEFFVFVMFKCHVWLQTLETFRCKFVHWHLVQTCIEDSSNSFVIYLLNVATYMILKWQIQRQNKLTQHKLQYYYNSSSLSIIISCFASLPNVVFHMSICHNIYWNLVGGELE